MDTELRGFRARLRLDEIGHDLRVKLACAMEAPFGERLRIALSQAAMHPSANDNRSDAERGAPRSGD